MGLILQIVKLKIFAKQINYGGKVLMFKSTVNQNAMIIIHLMFFGTYKNNWRESNFVGTIGNTIYKEWGMVYLQRVTMF
jgi:hypothetical protein